MGLDRINQNQSDVGPLSHEGTHFVNPKDVKERGGLSPHTDIGATDDGYASTGDNDNAQGD